MDWERTTDQILMVQFAPGMKGGATGGSKGARRMPGPSKDGAKRASYTRGTNTRARDILLFADARLGLSGRSCPNFCGLMCSEGREV